MNSSTPCVAPSRISARFLCFPEDVSVTEFPVLSKESAAMALRTTRLHFLAVLALGIWPFGSTCAAATNPAADLIITNAKVWSVDKSHPTAQAVAVLGEYIAAVGSNADVEAWRGSKTQVIDAHGKLLLPGFNDAHVHFISGGSQLDYVQLNDAASPQEFMRRIAEKARSAPAGEWILGGDWDETKWSSGGSSHQQIDRCGHAVEARVRKSLRRSYGAR